MKKLNKLIAGVNKLIAEVKIERFKEALKFLRILEGDTDLEVNAEVIKLESLLLRKIEELEEFLKDWIFLIKLGSLLYYYVYDYLSEGLVFLTLVSLLNGSSHMLLDVFTERGIYVKRNGKRRRVALAHFSYETRQ